jgi:putative ABC transport system substrate-binding protein
MKRRALIGAAAGLAAPCPALAQPRPARLPRLGMISAAFASEPVAFTHVRRELAALGWRHGETIQIEERHGNGEPGAEPRLAAEIMATQPDVIVVTGTTETRAAQQATRRIPIVFLQVVDPVALGLVASLARPGGNVTGAAASGQMLWGKRLEILAELLPPERRRVAVLNNPANPAHARNLVDIAEQAPRLGFTPRVLNLATPAAMAEVLAEAAQENAMLVPHDVILFPARRRVVAFAAQARLPAVYENRFSTEIGGMASYGADLRDNFRQGAIYVDRLLRGAQPGDLPVVQPNRVELVINVAALTALGLNAPPLLLARADEVIE